MENQLNGKQEARGASPIHSGIDRNVAKSRWPQNLSVSSGSREELPARLSCEKPMTETLEDTYR
jgi:hypothetical protein